MITVKQKAELVKRAEHHRKLDTIVQGSYWDGQKGCCVGCLVQVSSNWHAELEKQFGVPEWLGHLADRLFEGLTQEESKQFVVDFVHALPVKKNLKLVKPKFLMWTLQNLPKNYEARPDCKKAIEDIIRLLGKESIGKVVTKKTWSAARSAARSAGSAAWSAARSAESAAWSAARSAAASAAASAARSAESAAWSAARSAARSAAASAGSAAWSAAASAAYTKMAAKLLALLREA